MALQRTAASGRSARLADNVPARLAFRGGLLVLVTQGTDG